MNKRLLVTLSAAVAVAASLVVTGGASAGPEVVNATSLLTNPLVAAAITNDDVFATADLVTLLDPAGTNGTQHYGPYSSGSPDSGTCGNDWANDTFDREFVVHSNHDGTYTVVEQFKNGSFVTNAGPSPGSCDPSDGSPPGLVGDGVTGSMHGYFIISNVDMQTSTSPYCDAVNMTNDDCTTTAFVDTHFTPCYFAGTGTCPVTTYFDHYSAGDQSLADHEWKNASPDRGGNHGDIRSAP